MTHSNTDTLFSSWQVWFPGIPEPRLREYFNRWLQLVERSSAIGGVLTGTSMLPRTREIHRQVASKLNYEIPYRLVVLGETGAGKSTLINALLGQERLLTGAGGAVTGVPVYVHPIPYGEKEYVTVTYRTDAEFSALLKNMANRYDIALPDDRNAMNKAVEQAATVIDAADDLRMQVIENLRDILDTWRRIETAGDLGITRTYDPESDQLLLRQLMEEKGDRNALGAPSREVAGIARIDYFSRLRAQAGQETAWHSNIVLVDTPGIGAATLRHRVILLQEVEAADAVILVVGAERPEEKTRDIATILSKALLGVFTPEQREHFAQKVFLVVNKIDVLKNDEQNIRRLEKSIRELCRVISPNFWVTYVAQKNDQRYFETIADLAVYVDSARYGRSEDGLFQPQYEKYRVTELTEAERVSPNTHQIAYQKSQVPALRDKLSEFLGERRLQLMLEEARARLDLVIRTAEAERDEFFQCHSLKLDYSLPSDTNRQRLERELCKLQLDRDRQRLTQQYVTMWRKMQEWRRSRAYKESLKAAVSNICGELDFNIGHWLDAALADEKRFQSSRFTITGKETLEMAEFQFLHEAEQELRRLMEVQGQNLASYYLREFSGFVKRENLHDLVTEMTYAQRYVVERLKSKTSLSQMETTTADEFTNVCRWVTVYELMTNLLIAERNKSGDITPEIAVEVSEFVLNLAITAFSPPGQPQSVAAGTAMLKAKDLWIRFRPHTQDTSSAQSSPDTEKQLVTRDPQFDQGLQQLRAEISEALSAGDKAKIRELVGKQLSIRSRSALGKSLPYLDMLFFYELEKYERVYQEIVTAIYDSHYQVVHDYSAEYPIREILMRQNRAAFSDASQLLRVVAQLQAL